MATRLVDQLGDLSLRHPFIIGKPLISLRFFHRIEVFALDVLDQRKRHHFPLIKLANQRRNLVQTRLLRCPPTAFTRDQLVSTACQRPHDHRLDHPARSDRFRQLHQRLFVETAARLPRQWFDRRYRERCETRCVGTRIGIRPAVGYQRLFAPRLAHQRAKALAETLGLVRCIAQRDRETDGFAGIAHAAFLRSGSLPINSRASAI